MKLRFKIDKNAQQMNLTGMAVIHSGLNVVVVEGGPKSVKFYKKLMLQRIDWSSDPAANTAKHSEHAGDVEPRAANNKCYLVWEGRIKERIFGFFKIRPIPTESACRAHFEKMRCVHYWEAARNYIPDDVEAVTPDNIQEPLRISGYV